MEGLCRVLLGDALHLVYGCNCRDNQAAVAHSVLKGRCHYRAGGWVNHYSASAQHQEKSTIRKLEQRRDWEREVSLSISGGCPCFRRRSRRSGVVRRRHRRRIHWGCKAPDTRESSG